jgi:hypothetical protein
VDDSPALQAGAVFREYGWQPDGKWQRVTGPDVEDERARAFLPNAINTVEIGDLDGATQIEAEIEMLLCHGGTGAKSIRVNGGPWRVIPESTAIPGDAGRGGSPGEYQYMRYPRVSLELSEFRQGSSTFEFTCAAGTSLGAWWPQWLVYGAVFRVHYGSDKPHATGRVVSPSPGGGVDPGARFEAETDSAGVARVEFIARYSDFDLAGEGACDTWHRHHLYGSLRGHLGTAERPPYAVIWDNDWVPTQDREIATLARIVDDTGMHYVTPALDGLRFTRPDPIHMYAPYDVPPLWSTRAGKRHECKVDVTHDLSRAVDARIVMTTWHGLGADEIGINDEKLVDRIGRDHDLSHDAIPVPVSLIRQGVNTLYTYSDTVHHGIEVQWPGMVLFIRYSQ